MAFRLCGNRKRRTFFFRKRTRNCLPTTTELVFFGRRQFLFGAFFNKLSRLTFLNTINHYAKRIFD
ncbi:MAG: hypothetical protein D6714_03730 [Bacteroidetes bacterium]|nr:MAG: hypothetical protein D6714_03730 [Bacteroidota bacterium]